MKKLILSLLILGSLMQGCGSGGGGTAPTAQPGPSGSGQIGLKWNQVTIPPDHPEVVLKGYKIFWSLKYGDYSLASVKDVGDANMTMIEGLESGKVYHFAAKAYGTINGEYKESEFSDTLSVTAP